MFSPVLDLIWFSLVVVSLIPQSSIFRIILFQIVLYGQDIISKINTVNNQIRKMSIECFGPDPLKIIIYSIHGFELEFHFLSVSPHNMVIDPESSNILVSNLILGFFHEFLLQNLIFFFEDIFLFEQLFIQRYQMLIFRECSIECFFCMFMILFLLQN